MWRAIASSVPYLTEALRQRELQYTKFLNGRTERVPRWKECTDLVTQSLSVAVGALYVRKYFPKGAKEKATEIISDIKAEFIDILKGVDWMDNVTRSHALEKANAMVPHVAYPDELLSDKEIEGVFEGLNLTSNTYLEVRLSLTRFAADSSYKKLNQPVKKNDWISVGRPAVINAFYSFLDNSMRTFRLIFAGRA
uniref:Peptidase M13 N-terminal domain-containing protein n=3 Tax=Photinus pyralis TaxID=7054 RepID=A0A1Y1LUS7_PHOPY